MIAGECLFLEGVGGHFVRRTELGFLFIQAYFLGKHLLKLLLDEWEVKEGEIFLLLGMGVEGNREFGINVWNSLFYI